MADAYDLRWGFGDVLFPGTAVPAFSGHNLDAGGDTLAFVFRARRPGTLTRVGFHYLQRTGTPPTYIASLQGVASTGLPDGSIKGGGSPASVTFTPPADTSWDGTWRELALDNPYTCTRGEALALVIAHSSGTVDASNFSQIASGFGASTTTAFPYFVLNGTQGSGMPCWGYGTATEMYGRPLQSYVAQSFNTGSTPDEYAAKFTLPPDLCSTYTVGGLTILLGSLSSGGDTITIRLLDSDGTTVLQTATQPTNWAASAAPRAYFIPFTDAVLATLQAGTAYYLTVTTSDTSNYIVYYQTWASAGDRLAWPGGTSMSLATRTDGGAWTDDTTRRLVCNLHIDEMSGGSGGGGMSVIGRGGLAG